MSVILKMILVKLMTMCVINPVNFTGKFIWRKNSNISTFCREPIQKFCMIYCKFDEVFFNCKCFKINY